MEHGRIFRHRQESTRLFPGCNRSFANLRELEPSYIKGKLYTSETKRFTIPNTTDLPAFLAKLKG